MFNRDKAQRVARALPQILEKDYPPPEGMDPRLAEHLLTGAGALTYLMHEPPSEDRDSGLFQATLAFSSAAVAVDTEEGAAWVGRLTELITGEDDDPAVLSVLGSIAQVVSGRAN